MTSEIRERAYAWRLPLGLTVAIVAALCIRVANVWSELPETMGSHFSLSGEPDAFMSKAGFFGFMALLGGGTVALLFAMPRVILRLPARLINLPNRDYWLANDARRVEALSRLSSVLAWMAMATAALLVLATELAVRANLYQRPFENGPFLVFLGVYFVVVIGATVWKLRSFDVPRS